MDQSNDSGSRNEVPEGTEPDEVLVLNVGGIRHEIMQATLASQPTTKLGDARQLQHYFRPAANEYFFDRSPRLFDHILNFYRVGELHLPKCLCAREVDLELQFWNIDKQNLGSCCWLNFSSQCDSHVSMKAFESRRLEARLSELQRSDLVAMSCWERRRVRVWTILNEPYACRLAMAYAVVSMLVVMLSIFTLCASTSPHFKQNLTLSQYAEYYGVQPSELQDYWQNYDWFGNYFESYSYYSSYDMDTTISPRKKREVMDVGDEPPRNEGYQSEIAHDRSEIKLDNSPDGTNGDVWSFQQLSEMNDQEKLVFLARLILNDTSESWPVRRVRRSANGTSPTNETTVQSQYTLNSLLGAPHPVLEWIDRVCYAFIFLELLLRFVFCPSKRKFFTSMINMIDILAVLFYIVELVINHVDSAESYRVSVVDYLFIFRILRVFRIFRLAKHHKGLEVLNYTIKASISEIILLLIFLFIGVLLFGSLVYFTDHNDQDFLSIGHSFWWAIITMTTVGYGDMSPTTAGGKVVGTGCAISGVLLIAFTVPIIVNNFMLFYDQVQFGKDPDYLVQEAAAQEAKKAKQLDSSNKDKQCTIQTNGTTRTTAWAEKDITDV